MDRGTYHRRKKELRNNVYLGWFLVIIGILTCWLLVGVPLIWKGFSIIENAQAERDELEREFEQYQKGGDTSGMSA